MFDLPLILTIFTCCFILWYWYESHGIKDFALGHVKRHCQLLDLKLLDDSMVLRRHWFKRNQAGKWQFWRTYQFEFSSTGNDRYKGQIHLLGTSVLGIDLEAHRVD